MAGHGGLSQKECSWCARLTANFLSARDDFSPRGLVPPGHCDRLRPALLGWVVPQVLSQGVIDLRLVGSQSYHNDGKGDRDICHGHRGGLGKFVVLSRRGSIGEGQPMGAFLSVPSRADRTQQCSSQEITIGPRPPSRREENPRRKNRSAGQQRHTTPTHFPQTVATNVPVPFALSLTQRVCLRPCPKELCLSSSAGQSTRHTLSSLTSSW